MITIEVKERQKSAQDAEIQKVLGADYELEGPPSILMHMHYIRFVGNPLINIDRDLFGFFLLGSGNFDC